MELISRETSYYGTPNRRIDNVCVSWQLLFCASFSKLMTVSRVQGGRAAEPRVQCVPRRSRGAWVRGTALTCLLARSYDRGSAGQLWANRKSQSNGPPPLPRDAMAPTGSCWRADKRFPSVPHHRIRLRIAMSFPVGFDGLASLVRRN